jgi:hypothetical protein
VIRTISAGPGVAVELEASVDGQLLELFVGDEDIDARVNAVKEAVAALLSPGMVPDPVEITVEWHPARTDEHAPWIRILVVQREESTEFGALATDDELAPEVGLIDPDDNADVGEQGADGEEQSGTAEVVDPPGREPLE